MSTLFEDTEIEVVKVVVNKRNGTGSTTLYLTEDFWWFGAIYSSSPVTYPVLIDSPAAKRSCGINMAVRHNVNINIYAQAPLTNVNNTFADLLNTHDFHGAGVQIRYYSKSADGTATDSDSVNLRQVLEVVDVVHNQDENTIQLVCRDTWFDDKEFGHRYVDADFSTNVDNYKNQWVGEVAGFTFGDSEDGSTGVILSSCPMFKSELVSDGAGNTYQRSYIHCGVSDGANEVAPVKRSLYVRNPFKNLDSRSWLPLSTFNNTYTFRAPYKGPTTLVAGTDQPMYKWRVGCRVSPGSTARLIGGFTVRHTKTGTITAGSGQLMVTVREFRQLSGSNWTAVGNILAQVAIDPTTIGAAANFNYHLPVPLVLPPNRHYLVYGEWTNTTDTANYPNIKYDGAVTTDPCYTNDQTVSKDAWTETAAQAQIQVWDFGAESFILGSPMTGYYYHTQRLDNLVGGTNPYQFDGVDFKVGLYGAATTPYLTSSGIMENPASLIYYILKNTTFGLGLSSSDADFTEIESVRDTIGTGIKIAGTIESEISCGDFIQKICAQSRLRFYKKRNGKLSLNFPTPMPTSLAADITEAAYQSDVQCLGVDESSEGDLINKVDAVYKPDVLNLNQDLALGRRVKDSRYQSLEYIDASDSGTAGRDTSREALATSSQALYGKRYSLLRFDFHLRQAHAKKVVDYYFDRYEFERRRLTVRVLRKTWYNTIDLFSKVRIRHSLIPTEYGSRIENPGKSNDGSGTPVTLWYEGTQLSVFGMGEIKGEVLEITEQGPYMLLTVETMNSFEGYV